MCCRLSDAAEFKHTVAVLQWLANPHNDAALYAVLESKLSIRMGLGDQVLQALRKTQGDVREPDSCWHLLQRMARSPRQPAAKKANLQSFIEWHNRVFRTVMFMKLPEALRYVWKESGIAEKQLKKKEQKPSAQEPADSADPSVLASPVQTKGTPAKSASVAGSARKKKGATVQPVAARRVQVPAEHEVRNDSHPLTAAMQTVVHRASGKYSVNTA